jgi:hypothetical protein
MTAFLYCLKVWWWHSCTAWRSDDGFWLCESHKHRSCSGIQHFPQESETLCLRSLPQLFYVSARFRDESQYLVCEYPCIITCFINLLH